MILVVVLLVQLARARDERMMSPRIRGVFINNMSKKIGIRSSMRCVEIMDPYEESRI